MSKLSINASYTKNEHSSDIKPSISNTVNVVNSIGKREADEGVLDQPAIEITTEGLTPSPLNPLIKLPTRAELVAKAVPSIDETRRIAFEHRLLEICLAVLSSNDKVLIHNIIDTTGDIILSRQDLKELIQIITGSEDVQIIEGERAIKMSCLTSKKIGALIPVPVSKIVVNNQDFYVAYNRMHTMFAEYKLTLEKVCL